MKFSIITPTYRYRSVLVDTIESVINQKGDFEIEYIVRDAGKDPKIIELLKRYEKKIKEIPQYSNIIFRWISEADKGQSDAINKGLKICTGNIIAFINDDDTYEAGAFQKIVDFYKKHPNTKWLYGKCRIIDEDNKETRKFITLYKNLLLQFNSRFLLLSENYISQPATFWTREVLEKVGLLNINEYYCMDYDYWLRVLDKFGVGAFIPVYLANFRYYPDSKSGAVNVKQFQDELRIAIRYKSRNALAILLHKFNFYKITFTYKLMKLFN